MDSQNGRIQMYWVFLSMMLYGIASLFLSTAHAGLPAVAAIKPGTVGIMPKKGIAPEQKDKVPSTKGIVAEEKSPSSVLERESGVVSNVFTAPVRDASVKLKVSGFSQLDLAMTSQKKTQADKTGISNTPYFHIGNTKLKFEASVEKEKMSAGWLIRFDPQLNNNSLIDRNGVFWKHDDVGHVEAGNIKGVDDSLFKFAQGLIGGSNFWDSGLGKIFYQPEGSCYCDGVDFVGSTHTATKISYATPKIGDVLTLAASYTPNTAHRGCVGMTGLNQSADGGSKSKNNPVGFFEDKDKKYVPFGTNNVTLVAHLKKQCGDWTVGGSFAYIHDSAEIWAKSKGVNDPDVKYLLKDTNAFGVSGLLGYRKFNLGVEFMNNGQSRLPVDDTLFTTANNADGKNHAADDKHSTSVYGIENGHKGNAGKVFTVVAQYKWTDKLRTALAFQRTHRKLNDDSCTTRDTFAKTVNYAFMPGLEGYIETDLICLKREDKGTENKEHSNSGIVVMAGVRVNI